MHGSCILNIIMVHYGICANGLLDMGTSNVNLTCLHNNLQIISLSFKILHPYSSIFFYQKKINIILIFYT